MPWNSWPLFARFKPAPEAYAIACDWKEVTAALYTVRETRSEFSSSSFLPIPPSSFTRCATMLHTSDLFLGPPYRHDACRIINITTGVALVNETRQDNSLAINVYIYIFLLRIASIKIRKKKFLWILLEEDRDWEKEKISRRTFDRWFRRYR